MVEGLGAGQQDYGKLDFGCIVTLHHVFFFFFSFKKINVSVLTCMEHLLTVTWHQAQFIGVAFEEDVTCDSHKNCTFCKFHLSWIFFFCLVEVIS